MIDTLLKCKVKEKNDNEWVKIRPNRPLDCKRYFLALVGNDFNPILALADVNVCKYHRKRLTRISSSDRKEWPLSIRGIRGI